MKPSTAWVLRPSGFVRGKCAPVAGDGLRRHATDRPRLNFGWWDDRVYHYLARDPVEKYFGLASTAVTSI
jgi:alpha-glucosidase